MERSLRKFWRNVTDVHVVPLAEIQKQIEILLVEKKICENED